MQTQEGEVLQQGCQEVRKGQGREPQAIEWSGRAEQTSRGDQLKAGGTEQQLQDHWGSKDASTLADTYIEWCWHQPVTELECLQPVVQFAAWYAEKLVDGLSSAERLLSQPILNLLPSLALSIAIAKACSWCYSSFGPEQSAWLPQPRQVNFWHVSDPSKPPKLTVQAAADKLDTLSLVVRKD